MNSFGPITMGRVAAVSLVLCAAASARANLLTNGSFESGAWVDTSLGYMDVPTGSTVITGWTTTGNRVAWANTPTGDGVLAYDGSFSLDLTGFGNLTPNAGVTQSIATTPGAAYVLSFAVHVIPGYGTPAVVRADAGSTTLTITKASGGWEVFSLPFVASAASTPISLTGVQQSGTFYVGLDDVSVAPVPEATTAVAATLSLVVFGLGFRARRQGVVGA